MNTDALRHLFGYHFAENRLLWDKLVAQVSWEQFTRPSDYSHGSVRDQIIHLISVDNTWFSGLSGRPIPGPLDPTHFNSFEAIRTHWDLIEMAMDNYLDLLTDDVLTTQPLKDEDENLRVWQVLLQVVNHGTDHRSQIHSLLHQHGIKTVSQDYIFYVYENP